MNITNDNLLKGKNDIVLAGIKGSKAGTTLRHKILNSVSGTYKGGFFKNRKSLSWRAPYVCEALAKTYDLLQYKGNTIVDVGCAIGDYVKWFNDSGYVAWGIEGSQAAEEFMVTDQVSIWDLRYTLNMGSCESKYDLAFSLEVAEHIEIEYAKIYVDNLILLSDNILISAAAPGQKGHGHVNCAPRQFWINLFKEKGFSNMKEYENRWKTNLGSFGRTKKELSSYYKNVICFQRMGLHE